MSTGYHWFVFEWRYSILAICVLFVALNAALFLPTEIWTADLASLYISTLHQLLGMLLLFLLLPMWLGCSFVISQRHTLTLAGSLDSQVPEEQKISRAVQQFPGREIALGLGGGLLYALLFNVPPEQLELVLKGNLHALGMVLGQLLVWLCAALVLAIRLRVVSLFARLGSTIEFSVFEQRRLQPFARVGMVDIVIIVGALAIATVQSLDAQFRLENYLSAFVLAIPGGAALLIRPMWPLHKRLRLRKEELLADVIQQIAQASEASDGAAIAHMESLLQRRDRVQSLHTWPLDVGTWSRLAFYTLIPPLAWAGAALMEAALDRLLGL